MNFSQPPPELPPGGMVNFSMPPPSMPRSGGMMSMGGGSGKPGQPYFRPFNSGFIRGPGGIPMSQDDFDGKRLRKSVMRKTVDYNAAIIKSLETRIWQRDYRDRRALQPESIYTPEFLPPPSYMDNPSNAVTTKFVKTATNKMRCPIFTLAWTPEGRRLVTGASSGEFTLWNGLTFNFETILQAHDVPVRTMVWSHNDNWMVTGDHGGYVKYWQSNMNNVKMFQAHKEPIRGISFSPSDSKFASCSDDGTLRVWDFLRCQEERVLRGHGADVKCVHWHPQKALIVSGSKDNQQPIKLWDPKSGQALATLHAHKSTVMDLKWNDNGNWLVTASRDHLLKLFDLRNLSEEVQIFRGHKKEASAVSWHPVHEGLFSSGGSDGSILFWNVGTDKEVGAIDAAHDSIVWTLAWHPLGHILCSGSNDHTIKFWTRNRPGDQMRDKYNLNTLPAGSAGLDECEIEDYVIPGMGPEDKIEFTDSVTADDGFIPGLDLDAQGDGNDKNNQKEKKVPYSKPIPRNFQAQWNDTGRAEENDDNTSKEIKEVITQIVENTPGVVPLQKIAPSAIIVYGKMIQVLAGSQLEAAILEGPEALNKYISSGEIEELHDVMPHEEDDDSSTYENSSHNSPISKKARTDLDHNPTLIYDKDDSNSNGQQSQMSTTSFIPPLMAINAFSNFTNQDSDFRNYDKDDRFSSNNDTNNSNWQSGSNERTPWGSFGNNFTGTFNNGNSAWNVPPTINRLTDTYRGSSREGNGNSNGGSNNGNYNKYSNSSNNNNNNNSNNSNNRGSRRNANNSNSSNSNNSGRDNNRSGRSQGNRPWNNNRRN